jgi:hypothetical protein
MALCNVPVMVRLFDSLFSVRVICFLVFSLVIDQLFFYLEISFAGAVASGMSIPSVALNCEVHTEI